jgi:hypothetical protein
MHMARSIPLVLGLLSVASLARGEEPAAPATADVRPAGGAAQAWRSPGAASGVTRAGNLQPETQPPLRPVNSAPRQPLARVTKGPATLPNDAGQEWRDYDISPYTLRVTSTNKPEQAIVDWILRETGQDAWHAEPLGMLSANRRTLRVYHTPEMHAVVADIVDRFVSSEAETQAFGIRVVSIGSPNWRAKSHTMLKSVPVQSQGAQAWLLAKEDASLLLADLRRRTDFREHSSPHLLIHNGQPSHVALQRAHNYVRNVTLNSATWPGFVPEQAQVDEGFSLEFTPLLSVDATTIDAVLKCHVDQIEKMLPVMVDVPTPVAPRQRTKIEVPQMSSVRLHEKFRWPTDHVLLVSLGVVASPTPAAAGTAGTLTNALSLTNSGSRSDLLLFVENRGKTPTTPAGPAGGTREASNYKGRY